MSPCLFEHPLNDALPGREPMAGLGCSPSGGLRSSIETSQLCNRNLKA